MTRHERAIELTLRIGSMSSELCHSIAQWGKEMSALPIDDEYRAELCRKIDAALDRIEALGKRHDVAWAVWNEEHDKLFGGRNVTSNSTPH